MVDNKEINRRGFLKVVAAGSVAVGFALGNKDLSKIVLELSPESEYIVSHKKNPVSMALGYLEKGARVLALGEMHNEAEMEEMAVEITEKAIKKGLITFLALEVNSIHQVEIDIYLRTGVLGSGLKEELIEHTTKYEGLLRVCRDGDIAVLAVDVPKEEEPCTNKVNGFCLSHDTGKKVSRDDHMSEKILEHLNKNPKSKGIFYAGNLHVSKFQDILSRHLKEEYVSIIMVNNRSSNNPVREKYLETKPHSPVGLVVAGSPFVNYRHSPPDVWSNYGNIADALILFP